MPNWSNKPPVDPRGHGLPLVRTPASRSLVAIVTSDDLIGTDTHFWGGHTIPCSPPDCEACQAGVQYRWHAYLAAFEPDRKLHFIFEMTAQAAQAFVEYRNEFKSLRCCRFEAWRWKHTRNGRVCVKCENSGFSPAAIPKPPDLAKVMSIIWRLPTDNVWTAGQRDDVPRIHADPGGNGQSSDPREYLTPNP